MPVIKLKYIALIAPLFLCLLNSCYRDKPLVAPKAKTEKMPAPLFFPFILSEKTTIINTEQDNNIEGTYLKVLEVINDSTVKINLPDNFYLGSRSFAGWMLGWPTGKAYYDAGSENLREIISIDINNQQVCFGKLLRGNGTPVKDDRIVFWNRSPSGYKNTNGMLLHHEQWPSFAGESMEFGTVIFDSTARQWIMYTQPVDTTEVKIYAATSTDLLHWEAFNNGKPLFKLDDFKNTTWTGIAEDGKTPQTPKMYSAIYYKGLWHFFLSGYAKDGKRRIGTITSPDPLKGPFNIYPDPVINTSADGYDVRGCFYPKVGYNGKHFLLYYDGVASDKSERLCLAESDDLMNWKKYAGNPVWDNHYGWRSGAFATEPNYVKYSGDTVWVMMGGYKKYNTEFYTDDSLNNTLPLDKSIFSAAYSENGKHISGNVQDAALGAFLSFDGGHTFRPHVNNPIWINDYSDTLQNDHLGGDLFFAALEPVNYVIYQGKSESQKRYNILLRAK